MCSVASVESDSLRPYGLQSARLLRPWNFSGKNNGVGCRALLQGPNPGVKPTSPALAGRFFIIEPPGKLQISNYNTGFQNLYFIKLLLKALIYIYIYICFFFSCLQKYSYCIGDDPSGALKLQRVKENLITN